MLALGGGVNRVHLGEHSVEDHYLHKNGIIFGGSSQFLGGDSPKTGLPGRGHMVCVGGGGVCGVCGV